MKKRVISIIIVLFLAINLVGCSSIKKDIKEGDESTESSYEERVNKYKHMIKENPTDDQAYLKLAKVYKLMELPKLVEKTLKDGIENVEKNIPLQLLLTDYYLECLEYEMSEKNALEVLKKDVKNSEAYIKLLYIYDQQGQFEKLNATYEKYQGKIDSDKGKLFLAKAYLRQHNKIEATKRRRLGTVTFNNNIFQ